MQKLPLDIERESFAILTAELGETNLPEPALQILKRVIHTSADFDYKENLCFSSGVVEATLEALRQGCDIVTDTEMVKAGINKHSLARLGGEVHCFMHDSAIIAEAKHQATTRADVAMQHASTLEKPCIVAVGNAPTALLRLVDIMAHSPWRPVCVIAVPVGFVNVVEAKEAILASAVPSIVARGRKGGSPIAAAICNALLYQITR